MAESQHTYRVPAVLIVGAFVLIALVGVVFAALRSGDAEHEGSDEPPAEQGEPAVKEPPPDLEPVEDPEPDPELRLEPEPDSEPDSEDEREPSPGPYPPPGTGAGVTPQEGSSRGDGR